MAHLLNPPPSSLRYMSGNMFHSVSWLGERPNEQSPHCPRNLSTSFVYPSPSIAASGKHPSSRPQRRSPSESARSEGMEPAASKQPPKHIPSKNRRYKYRTITKTCHGAMEVSPQTRVCDCGKTLLPPLESCAAHAEAGPDRSGEPSSGRSTRTISMGEKADTDITFTIRVDT